MMITVFCLVEIWPIWHVLDGGFVDMFIDHAQLSKEKDIREHLLVNYGRIDDIASSEANEFNEAVEIPQNVEFRDVDERGRPRNFTFNQRSS